tara:strand:- start:61 stop:480 length:420 start_codon:yes stop_codon:yes gene_type:complete
MIFLNKYPSIKLEEKGIRVVNYSSPHPYTFHTGEVLPACSDEVARETKLEANHSKVYNDKGWHDVSINYALSKMQEDELTKLVDMNITDIILVPYSVMKALKDSLDWEIHWYSYVWDKIRVCKLHDRVTKVIRSDEFCI